MVTVPGLRPLDEDEDQPTRRNRGRVLTDDSPRSLRPRPLRPTAAPVDTYARPAPPPIDNDLDNFSKALAVLNPALNRFADVQERENQEGLKDRVAAKLAGKTNEEIEQLRKSDPDVGHRMAGEYVGRLQATQAADSAQQDLFRHYEENFDKNRGPEALGKFVDEWVANRAQQYAGNKGYASTFLDRALGIRKTLVDHHTKQFSAAQVAKTDAAVQGGMLSEVRQVVDLDGKPEDAVKVVNGILLANKELLRKPYKEQQGIILGMVGQLTADMERNPEKRAKIMSVIETLLEGERPDPQDPNVKRRLTEAGDGVGAAATKVLAEARSQFYKLNDRHGYQREADLTTLARTEPEKIVPERDLDPLIKDGTITAAVAKSILVQRDATIRANAQAVRELEAERGSKSAEDVVVQQRYDEFRRGVLNGVIPGDKVPTKGAILNGTDETREVSSAAVQERVFSIFQDHLRATSNHLVKTKKLTPEQVPEWTRNQELALYSANGVAPEAWKTELNAGFWRSNRAEITAKQVDPQTLEAIAKYRTVSQNHPHLLPKITDDNTRTFYGMVDAARAAGADTDAEAVAAAANYMRNREKTKDRESAVRGEVVKALENETDGFFSRVAKRVFGVDALTNPGVLYPAVVEHATLIATAYHVPKEKAVELAMKHVRSRYAVVNGTAIDVNNKNLGMDFEKRAEKFLDMVFQAHGKELGLSSRRDLQIVPYGPDTFHVINSNTMRPISHSLDVDVDGQKMHASVLTLDHLNALASQARKQAATKAVRAETQAREPTMTLRKSQPGREIPVFLGKSTPEMTERMANDRAREEAERAARRAASPTPTMEQFRRKNREILGIPDRGGTKDQGNAPASDRRSDLPQDVRRAIEELGPDAKPIDVAGLVNGGEFNPFALKSGEDTDTYRRRMKETSEELKEYRAEDGRFREKRGMNYKRELDEIDRMIEAGRQEDRRRDSLVTAKALPPTPRERPKNLNLKVLDGSYVPITWETEPETVDKALEFIASSKDYDRKGKVLYDLTTIMRLQQLGVPSWMPIKQMPDELLPDLFQRLRDTMDGKNDTPDKGSKRRSLA